MAAAAAAASGGNTSARKLYDVLIASPAAAHFKVLPDPLLYPSYYAVIARPVCLADINILIGGAARYSLADMLRDLRRMVGNAKRYNVPESQVYQDALVLEVSARVRSRCELGHACTARVAAAGPLVPVPRLCNHAPASRCSASPARRLGT